MLKNIPSAEGLDEVALRLHFDAWKRCLALLSDFSTAFESPDFQSWKDDLWENEWKEYVEHAQPEIGTICATIQQAAELRLKAIICETSPYLLLLNSTPQFKKKGVDFSELRTLDATDLPDAVRSLTTFSLPASYLEEYGKMRKLRNQVMHLGAHNNKITPQDLIEIMSQQYVSLWPDGRWLCRRTRFDGNSARNFFHDGRHLSTESNVMGELPFTIGLMDNKSFKKSLGVPKGKLKGFCPACMYARATKWDETGHATACQTGENTAHCLMCEQDLVLSLDGKGCETCGKKTFVAAPDPHYGAVCFVCGQGPFTIGVEIAKPVS